MKQHLHDHPGVHDALYARKPYAEEVGFALERAPAADRALVVGCRTGEHVRRFEAAGVEAVGVDPYPALIEHARERSDSTFHVGGLPELPVDGAFDLVLAPFMTVNRLAADELEPALAALADRAGEDGTLVLDTGEYPDMESPTLRTASGIETGEEEKEGAAGSGCALFEQFRRSDGREVRVESVVLHGESWFADGHELVEFENDEIGTRLADLGFVVKREDWLPDPTTTAESSVFVASR
ncbi:class I SAM-dependent methyltransferase [Halalkalicoccus tibetensis]|uniref:Class I SAM-dependent methyltransferase n=1 Tax=Halalkalicoccus tibetensis TaxID=175632 RepID=A0ABD5V0A4_9EURY